MKRVFMLFWGVCTLFLFSTDVFAWANYSVVGAYCSNNTLTIHQGGAAYLQDCVNSNITSACKYSDEKVLATCWPGAEYEVSMMASVYIVYTPAGVDPCSGVGDWNQTTLTCEVLCPAGQTLTHDSIYDPAQPGLFQNNTIVSSDSCEYIIDGAQDEYCFILNTTGEIFCRNGYTSTGNSSNESDLDFFNSLVDPQGANSSDTSMTNHQDEVITYIEEPQQTQQDTPSVGDITTIDQTIDSTIKPAQTTIENRITETIITTDTGDSVLKTVTITTTIFSNGSSTIQTETTYNRAPKTTTKTIIKSNVVTTTSITDPGASGTSSTTEMTDAVGRKVTVTTETGTGDGVEDQQQQVDEEAMGTAPDYGDYSLGDTFDRLAIVSGIGSQSEFQVELSTQSISMFDTFKDTFPFSLILSPLSSIADNPATPSWTYVVNGVSHTMTMDAFDELFAVIRAIMGMLLIWGFWLTMVDLTKRFAVGGG